MRFISVTDQFDSKIADFSEKSFVVPIKNFVNESYLRDSALERERLQRRVQELGEMINGRNPDEEKCFSGADDGVFRICLLSWNL